MTIYIYNYMLYIYNYMLYDSYMSISGLQQQALRAFSLID